MSLSHTECTKWKELLEQTFQRKRIKQWREIVIDILCVDTGLKSALLWDYPSLSKEKLEHLLTEAKSKCLLKNTLCVILIEMDIMILNEDSLRGDNTVLDLNLIKAVDVSYDLARPEVIRDLKLQKTLNVCEDILKGRMDNVTVEQEIFNPTSLFGLLLHYPVVYWYDMSDAKDGNCLAYQPLRVYKVVGQLKTSQTESKSLKHHTVFSFSVPDCVREELCSSVSEWFGKILERNKWRTLFNNLCLEEKSVTLPSVCL